MNVDTYRSLARLLSLSFVLAPAVGCGGGADDNNESVVVTGDFSGVVMEDANVNMVTGSLSISDPNTGEAIGFPDVTGAASDNGYGIFKYSSSTWTYTLDNTRSAVNALAAGATLSDGYTFTADNGTTQEITITIKGTDDAAVIAGDIVGAVTEDADASTATGTLTISDVDTGQSPSFPNIASAVTQNNYGVIAYDSGTWTFTLDNANARVNALAAGAQLTDSFIFTANNADTQEITLTITGADDASEISGDISGTVTEDDAMDTATGSLSISDVDEGDSPGFENVPATPTDNNYGTIELNSGVWVFTLDNTNETVNTLASGDELTDTYTFRANDGNSQQISVTIFGSDEAGAVPSVTLLWESEASLQVPESVRFDPERGVLYVSSITGAPWASDGVASIARVSLDGTVLDANWISGADTGLNAPKGMAIYDGRLYVADLNIIVVIDIDEAEVVDHINVTGASGLNDISISEDGIIYVTDSFAGVLTQIESGTQTALLSGYSVLNGVYVEGDNINFLSSAGLHAHDIALAETRLITSGFEGSPDGIEKISENSWFVTSWEGVSYVVHENSAEESVTTTKVLDTRAQEVYSADPGFNPETNTVYLPTFWGNSIQAFQVDLLTQ